MPASNVTVEDVVLRLHSLASLDRVHPELWLRTDTQAIDGLLETLGKPSHAKKFMSLAQAIVTLCTAGTGEESLALMIGFSATQTHLFLAQNGGPPLNQVETYLHSIWKVLQELRAASLIAAVDPSIISSPVRHATPAEIDIVRELLDLAYQFVPDRALHRANKHCGAITALHKMVAEETTADPFDLNLAYMIHNLSTAATIASTVNHDDLPTNHDWMVFRACSSLLYDLTLSPEYAEALRRLQERTQTLAIEQFDLEKCIEEMITLERASVTLYALAASSRRNWILTRDLCVHGVPTPDEQPTHILPSGVSDLTQRVGEMPISASSSINSDRSGVHCECQLVAWVAQNVAPDITLIPYVKCSKLHCFACHIWLESYNRLGNPVLPKVTYDGGYGGLKPGWRPPSLQATAQRHMLDNLVSRIEKEILIHKHAEAVRALVTRLGGLGH
ncbi:hypothetical protein B0H11DRAFT_2286428 [Mycena galericulata]|nr:hypothetical protein B0H11DRAFT_2286428 [Mycena galericulata]